MTAGPSANIEPSKYSVSQAEHRLQLKRPRAWLLATKANPISDAETVRAREAWPSLCRVQNPHTAGVSKNEVAGRGKARGTSDT